MRSPHLPGGCQWKNVRCSQYSLNVQATNPAAERPRLKASPSPTFCTACQSMMRLTGTQTMGTTDQWVREKKSTKSLSNILGDSGVALSTLPRGPEGGRNIGIALVAGKLAS